AGLMVMQDCTLSEPISFPANKPSNIICTADIYFSSDVDYFTDLSNGQRVYILNAGDWASQKTSGVSKGFRVSHASSLLAFSSLGGAGSVMCRGGNNQASMAVEVTSGTAYLLGGTYGSLA